MFRVGLVLRITCAETTDVRRYSADCVESGRRASNDLVLEHPRIAARHLRLARGPGNAFTLNVLARLLPTSVNGHAARGEMRLEEGDVATIGPYEIEPLDSEPPCAQERDFLAKLPYDEDALGAVYADWLEERDRTHEAAFLRLRIEARAAARSGGTGVRDASERLRELAAKVPLSWRRAIAHAPIENCDLRFEMVCPKQWAALAPTTNANERYCDACQKHVFYAPDIATAMEHARLQRCLVVDPTQARRPNDLKPRPMLKMGMVVLR